MVYGRDLFECYNSLATRGQITPQLKQFLSLNLPFVNLPRMFAPLVDLHNGLRPNLEALSFNHMADCKRGTLGKYSQGRDRFSTCKTVLGITGEGFINPDIADLRPYMSHINANPVNEAQTPQTMTVQLANNFITQQQGQPPTSHPHIWFPPQPMSITPVTVLPQVSGSLHLEAVTPVIDSPTAQLGGLFQHQLQLAPPTLEGSSGTTATQSQTSSTSSAVCAALTAVNCFPETDCATPSCQPTQQAGTHPETSNKQISQGQFTDKTTEVGTGTRTHPHSDANAVSDVPFTRKRDRQTQEKCSGGKRKKKTQKLPTGKNSQVSHSSSEKPGISGSLNHHAAQSQVRLPPETSALFSETAAMPLTTSYTDRELANALAAITSDVAITSGPTQSPTTVTNDSLDDTILRDILASLCGTQDFVYPSSDSSMTNSLGIPTAPVCENTSLPATPTDHRTQEVSVPANLETSSFELHQLHLGDELFLG